MKDIRLYSIISIVVIGVLVLTACGTASDSGDNQPAYTVGILDPLNS